MKRRAIIALVGLAMAALLLAVTSEEANAQIETKCMCGGAACAVGAKEKVDVRKTPDLAIVSANPDPTKDDPDGPGGAPATVEPENQYATRLTANVAKVKTVQDAIAAINARFVALGRKVNVVIVDHGAPGETQIGDERMGIKEPLDANLDKFIGGVKDQIEHLTLVSCRAADGTNGQAFISRLRTGIRADLIKGFTGTIELQWDSADKPGTINAYVVDGDKKKVGGVAELPDAAAAPLEAGGSSGGNAGVLVGIAAAAAAGAVALGGAAWYARRRWLR